MDWKSTKLTNILLFIIVCFFVVGALCGLGRMAFDHRVFEGKFGGCQMQGQYKNLGDDALEGKCAYKPQGEVQNKNSCPHANLEELPAAPATAAAE